MSVEQNKTVMRRWMDSINNIDWDVLDKIIPEIYADDYIFHDPSYAGFEPGPTGAKKWIRQELSSLPELRLTIEDIFGEGDKMVTRISLHYNEAQTGNPMIGWGMVISYFRNGKITQEWQLLNIQPEPASSA